MSSTSRASLLGGVSVASVDLSVTGEALSLPARQRRERDQISVRQISAQRLGDCNTPVARRDSDCGRHLAHPGRGALQARERTGARRCDARHSRGVSRLPGEVRVKHRGRRVPGSGTAPAPLVILRPGFERRARGLVLGAAPARRRWRVRELAKERAPALRPRGLQRASISPSGKRKGLTASGPTSARCTTTAAISVMAFAP